MQLIRKGVFETNSSSAHSVSVGTSDVFHIPTPNSNGEIHLITGEFGWEMEHYSGFYDMAAYLILYIRDWSRNQEKQHRQFFEELLKEATQCTEIVYPEGFWDTRSYQTRTYYCGPGYIDHQSVESSELDYLFEDKMKMKNYLFGDSSITTDNDNRDDYYQW